MSEDTHNRLVQKLTSEQFAEYRYNLDLFGTAMLHEDAAGNVRVVPPEELWPSYRGNVPSKTSADE